MTCPLCDQRITPPLIELWCPTCDSYVRTHDGCTPGVESTKHGVSLAAQARIRDAHAKHCKKPNGTRYLAPWDKPLERYESGLPASDLNAPTRGMRRTP